MLKTYWSQEEEQELCRLYEVKASARTMAQVLGRSRGALQAKACRMGLTARESARGFVPQEYVWGEADVDKLRQLWAQGVAPLAMASQIGRSISAVYRKLARLGLGHHRRGQMAKRLTMSERSDRDIVRFRRLLQVLVWCKLSTGKSSKEIVSAVLQDPRERTGRSELHVDRGSPVNKSMEV